MGMSVQEVLGLTLWEYTAAIHEWQRRNSDETAKGQAPSEEEYEEIMAEFESWNLPDMVFN